MCSDDGVCLGAACDDGVANGAESDVDCGGACPACPDGGACIAGQDCASAVCTDGECQAPTCDDFVRNGDETGSDCGGPDCGVCGAGQGCNDADDCASEVCTGRRCQAPTCEDGVLNGNEVAVDCGGNACDGCDPGEACRGNDDCASLVCTNDVCVADTCEDEVQNGNESDVDCGGGDCDECPDGGACEEDADCASDVCVDDACARLRSCLEIISSGRSDGDGVYEIDPDGDEEGLPFDVFCDMTTDDGGWTEINLEAAAVKFGAEMVAVLAAPTAGIDAENRPFTRDAGGDHTYHYTIEFPPGFTEFYLADYVLKANAGGGGHTSDIYFDRFVQETWAAGFLGGGVGDVSFGAASEDGPTTSFARHLDANFDCAACELEWPAGADIFGLEGGEATQFRIGWGEAGGQAEGWFPWWSGTIRVR